MDDFFFTATFVLFPEDWRFRWTLTGRGENMTENRRRRIDTDQHLSSPTEERAFLLDIHLAFY
jgi:hypothetical protein